MRRSREQRKIVRGGAHVVPVRGALDEVGLALREAGCPRPRANRIGGLAGEQRLVARNEIGRQQLLREVSRQGVGSEFQGTGPYRMRGVA